MGETWGVDKDEVDGQAGVRLWELPKPGTGYEGSHCSGKRMARMISLPALHGMDDWEVKVEQKGQ